MLKPHPDNSSDLEHARQLSRGLARRDRSPEHEGPAAATGYVDLRGMASPPAAPAPAVRGENVASGFEPDAEAFGSAASATSALQREEEPEALQPPTSRPPTAREADSAAVELPDVAKPDVPQPESALTLDLEHDAGLEAAFDALPTPAADEGPAETDGGFEFAVTSDDEDPFADLDVFDDPEPLVLADEADGPATAQAEVTARDDVDEPPAAAESSGFDLTGSDDDDELDELFDGILGGDES